MTDLPIILVKGHFYRSMPDSGSRGPEMKSLEFDATDLRMSGYAREISYHSYRMRSPTGHCLRKRINVGIIIWWIGRRGH